MTQPVLPGLADSSSCGSARQGRSEDRGRKKRAEGTDPGCFRTSRDRGTRPAGHDVPPGGWAGCRDRQARQAATTGDGQGGRSGERDGRRQGLRRTSEVVEPRAGEGAALTGKRCGLTDEDREWVRRTVAGLGPLADEDRDYLALIFSNHR